MSIEIIQGVEAGLYKVKNKGKKWIKVHVKWTVSIDVSDGIVFAVCLTKRIGCVQMRWT